MAGDPGAIDASWFQWIVGGLAAIGASLLAYSHGSNSSAIKETKTSEKEARDDIWKVVNTLGEARVEMERRLADYPKRDDLRNMRDEVKELLREQREDLDRSLDKTLAALDRRISDNMRLMLAESQRSTIDMVRAIVENRAPIKNS